MDSISVETTDGKIIIYWLPANEAEVIQLVNDAKINNEIICMRGAAHSFPLINTLEANATGRKYKYVMLSKMNNVNIDTNNSTVTVDAGCHLGYDPFDPTNTSTLQNSLLYKLDQAGLAVSDLGGITHQTVGGFLATGSSGGSTQVSFEEALISIDVIICGANGAEKVTYKRPVPDNPNDPFYGIGICNIGIFGIVTSATFQCVPKFFIEGQEATTLYNTCEFDLFGDGGTDRPSFQTFLETTQYTRIMLWPQENVQKVVVWKAKQTDEAGAKQWADQAYKKMKKPPAIPASGLKPYQEVPWIFGSPVPANLGADLLFTAIGTWPDWLTNLSNNKTIKTIIPFVEAAFYPMILPKLLDIFVTLDKPDNNNGGPQQFSDLWYLGLPMDNQMGDRLMPVWFTELWIDINKTKDVMTELAAFYSESTDNTGAFSCEIYAAKKNNFWVSPSYNTNVIRIDIFWFGNNKGNPVDFYKKYWSRLAQFQFRPHWGKYLPDGTSAQGVDYLKSLYPKWNDWMALREKNDPDQIFLNDYWRGHLGIDQPVKKLV